MYGAEDGRSTAISAIDNIHETLSTVTLHGHGVRLPEGMTEETALRIYASYDLQHRYDNSLPITRYRQDVSLSVCLSLSWCVSVYVSLCQYLYCLKFPLQHVALCIN